MCHRVMETSTVRLSSELGTSGHWVHLAHRLLIAITYTCNNIYSVLSAMEENRAVNEILRIFDKGTHKKMK